MRQYITRKQVHRLGTTYTDSFGQTAKDKMAELLNDKSLGELREEFALAKTMLAAVGRTLSKDVAAAESMPVAKAAVIIKLLQSVTQIGKTMNDVEQQRNYAVSYRVVLLLLDAAIKTVTRRLGFPEIDSKAVLMEILPELPWPTGVARLEGAEHLFDDKDNLTVPVNHKKHSLLPKTQGLPPRRSEIPDPNSRFNEAPIEVNAEFETLDVLESQEQQEAAFQAQKQEQPKQEIQIPEGCNFHKLPE